MTKSPLKRASIALVAVVAVVSLAAGCSSSSSKSSEAKYCESWQKVVDSFSALDGIAITTSGLSGLTTAVDDITAAAKDLASSADSLLKPKVEALQDALTSFGNTLSSPQLSTDYLDKLKSESQKVDDAWNDLVSTAKTSCPDVQASSV
jgi:ABC-type transporter Mla subunit MlaD